jgi:Rod binding domain-containing protein
MNSLKSVGPPTANPFGDPELPSPASGSSSVKSKATTKSETAAQNEKAATELEAYFMRTVMAETRGNLDDSSVDGGFAGGTFREMLDGALTDKMASGQGMGLKKVIVDSLERAEKIQENGGKLPAAVEQARRMTSHSAVDAIAAHRALKNP